MDFNVQSDLVRRAHAFASQAHGAINQKRRHSGEDYITHSESVALIVARVPHTEAMLAAALLHDVVEDTPVTLSEIEAEFGGEVASLVYWLTDCDLAAGTRAVRKAKDRERLAQAPAAAQTIKLADLLDNTPSIVEHDPGFASVYLREKAEILEALLLADASLMRQARLMLTQQDARLRLPDLPT